MAVDTSLRTLLAAEATITSLLASTTAVYVDSTDQNKPMPYLSITKTGGDPMKYLSSTSGMQRAEIEIDSVAESRITANAINTAVFAYIKDYSGAAGSDTINAVLVEDDGTNDAIPIGQGTENYKYITTLGLVVLWTSA